MYVAAVAEPDTERGVRIGEHAALAPAAAEVRDPVADLLTGGHADPDVGRVVAGTDGAGQRQDAVAAERRLRDDLVPEHLTQLDTLDRAGHLLEVVDRAGD